jgi:hypothetical protein
MHFALSPAFCCLSLYISILVNTGLVTTYEKMKRLLQTLIDFQTVKSEDVSDKYGFVLISACVFFLSLFSRLENRRKYVILFEDDKDNLHHFYKTRSILHTKIYGLYS